jgi:hypothetical protein
LLNWAGWDTRLEPSSVGEVALATLLANFALDGMEQAVQAGAKAGD